MYILKVYSINYTLKQNTNVKKFPPDKINGTKNAFFFLLQVPAYHSFNFNLRFLHELKHKVRFSKTVYGNFHFQFRFVFIKVYIFVQQNSMDSFTLKRHNFFLILGKPHTVLFPDL